LIGGNTVVCGGALKLNLGLLNDDDDTLGDTGDLGCIIE